MWGTATLEVHHVKFDDDCEGSAAVAAVVPPRGGNMDHIDEQSATAATGAVVGAPV